MTEALQTSQYLYTINETVCKVTKETYNEDIEDLGHPEIISSVDADKSFSALNLHHLINGNLRKIDILDEITCGSCGKIERSLTSERFTWMPHFSKLSTMPIPHMNLISCIGMGYKQEYLVWRKDINGFFTALNIYGDILTWSYVNGKLLYTRHSNPDEPGSRLQLHGYAVYRTDATDTFYSEKLI